MNAPSLHETCARRLTLDELLAAVSDHQVFAYEYLVAEAGFHPKVVASKFEKAARRGYTEYGVALHRAWLTEKGKAWLAAAPMALSSPP